MREKNPTGCKRRQVKVQFLNPDLAQDHVIVLMVIKGQKIPKSGVAKSES